MKPIENILVDMPTGLDILDYAIEINPVVDGFNNFNRINETLKRVGLVSATKPNMLVQTCHIYRHEERYYLMHFLMMFMLGGKTTNITQDDIDRNKIIAKMLQDWGLISILTPEKVKDAPKGLANLRVVKYRESNEWILHPMYHMKQAADKD